MLVVGGVDHGRRVPQQRPPLTLPEARQKRHLRIRAPSMLVPISEVGLTLPEARQKRHLRIRVERIP